MIELELLSDSELLARTPGDADAFAVFYRRHSRAVLAFVARRAAPPDVGDLVAEVFATALVHCRRYDPARGAAGAWLAGIALNKLAETRRRGAAEARMCRRLGIRRPVLEEEALDVDIGGEELLASLPDEQRVAVEGGCSTTRATSRSRSSRRSRHRLSASASAAGWERCGPG